MQFTYLAWAVQALDAPFGHAVCIDFAQNDFKLVVGLSCLRILYRIVRNTTAAGGDVSTVFE